ncbi:hypothetical protein FRC03_006215 [Tulasnella sp. 419]|nr:hypothetical protein FRC03_006215 [Tulasnella sp. 419]
MALPTSKSFIGAVKDEWVMYSDDPSDYSLGPPIGFGASSIVYQAVFHYKDPSRDGKVTDIPCALKVLDLDKLQPSALKLLTRETQLMSLSKHPNVIRVRGSWTLGHKLYIAMRLMNKGSVADIVKYSFVDGLEEEVIKCILQQALEGLNYLHINGFIHRDIKAANLLVDDDGTVLLGDLGVAVSLADEEDQAGTSKRSMGSNLNGGGGGPLIFGASNSVSQQSAASKQKDLSRGKRKSFVGTPSWMAPEVIAQQHYDSAADIWSLGITVLELCSGRAPGSRERDVKRVLLGTLQNAPPTLDRDGGRYKYSKALKELVESCLNKDPAQRPPAANLLQHPFFKGVKKKSYLVGALLANLPPLSARQERRLLHSHQHGHKFHPLSKGSPSVTSLATAHSWDWSYSIHANSPRSSHFGNKKDAAGSVLSDHGLHISPSSSVASLHARDSIDSSQAGHQARDRSHSYTRLTSLRATSPTRPSKSHSAHVPPLEQSVFEMEGEEGEEGEPLEMKRGRSSSALIINGLAHSDPLSTPRPGSPCTPPADENKSATPVDLDHARLQPPELSSTPSDQPSSLASSPGTPPLQPNQNLLVHTASEPASPVLSPNSPTIAPTLERTKGRSYSSNTPSVGRGLWKKMKSAGSKIGGTNSDEKEKERKSGFGAFLERTVSRGGR